MSLAQLPDSTYTSKDRQDITLWRGKYLDGVLSDEDVRVLIKDMVKRKLGTHSSMKPAVMLGRLRMAQDLSRRISDGRVRDIHLVYGSGFARKVHDIGKKIITTVVPLAIAGKAIEGISKSGAGRKAQEIQSNLKEKIEIPVKPFALHGSTPFVSNPEQPFFDPNKPQEASVFSTEIIITIVAILIMAFVASKIN